MIPYFVCSASNALTRADYNIAVSAPASLQTRMGDQRCGDAAVVDLGGTVYFPVITRILVGDLQEMSRIARRRVT